VSNIKYADTPIGEAALANLVAAAMVQFAPTNEKVMLAAEAMIGAASLSFATSFNIEEMINELLDGIPLINGETAGKE